MITKTDFMCRCSPESAAKAQACLDRVKRALDATDADLLTKVVFALEWSLGPEQGDFYGGISGIACDQWCGVSASVRAPSGEANLKEADEYARIRVQCDRVEDGIARVWELAEEAVSESEKGS